jgi:hypothetical protein
MLGQSTLRCINTLLKKKKLVRKINLIHVNTKDHIIDIFTKALGTYKLSIFRKILGVLEVDLSLKGNVENSNSIS